MEKRFKDALEMADANRELVRTDRMPSLVELYLTDLMSQGHYEEAAAECPLWLKKTSGAEHIGISEVSATLWERWILAFINHHQMPALAKHIP
eukprot:CAMPEP_0185785172 /NCGR_PEP_ID=MMETSP1174-20130828/128062_1 /TAXON_ID=35687 /ORGANISM="Dictyocha speculum, Strain CCMP1381" /LENGTH=92 /DNA_ID=CAMNT_0028477137 /DNA_START=108 /DNA_END=382 /DNA_ORIENTATION=+